MTHKRWFQALIFSILFFLLILLIYYTNFIFIPIFKYIGAIAFPLIGAGILYYLTRPLMVFFERRLRTGRIGAIILVFIVILTVLTVFITYVWPIIEEQITNLVYGIPGMIAVVEDIVYYIQANYASIPDQIIVAVNDFMGNIPQHVQNLLDHLFGFLGSIIGQVVSIVAGLVMMPFFLFFMLKDGERLVPFIIQIFKKKKADNIRSLLSKIDHVLSSFIQGQLFVSFCVGVMLYIGYIIIDLNYALLLALFGLVTNVIPYLGPFIAVTPALLVGTIQDPINFIWVAIIMIIAQQIESNLISPNVMGQALNLHPMTVMTVVVSAGSIAGFLGILFAVPVYAVVRTIIVHFYQTYVESKENKEEALL
ncbi:AI-2E family transporter [Oceanobacillus piezotolerans]|uniref:AI-2E family transporter n=1 Tax=Oceanobacillus piezotolerans TaxID=2448030 RepID=A0A498D3R6_9BACI|nr:AI-2E family transporter [Oceanobacillus piezotolerans]RLL42832.1 AI-2E family transporter [Oceanobacillus piezotolerans]